MFQENSKIEVTRWERRLAIPLSEIYSGTTIKCCDCDLKHFFRIEGNELALYPIRPKDYKYPEEKWSEWINVRNAVNGLLSTILGAKSRSVIAPIVTMKNCIVVNAGFKNMTY